MSFRTRPLLCSWYGGRKRHARRTDLRSSLSLGPAEAILLPIDRISDPIIHFCCSRTAQASIGTVECLYDQVSRPRRGPSTELELKLGLPYSKQREPHTRTNDPNNLKSLLQLVAYRELPGRQPGMEASRASGSARRPASPLALALHVRLAIPSDSVYNGSWLTMPTILDGARRESWGAITSSSLLPQG